MNGCKISPVGLGLSLGILWGLSLLAMGLIAYFYTYGRPLLKQLPPYTLVMNLLSWEASLEVSLALLMGSSQDFLSPGFTIVLVVVLVAEAKKIKKNKPANNERSWGQ